ncbi:response regulator transcription factor [Paenibacillus sp. J2TS4]|uniref:response regulator transcription factor n=1 Tax=Paenibacillus sp. J2TS4 TaxID=2807194 RepID=UPI001B148F89|nr:response regulator transcription factor [Paenibacillus sp. J2TS4]GIP34304.1 DNA-binding response regulator [Paenibacillus sp. J2TS4]
MNNRILVVDDEPSIAMLLDYNLKLADYDVRCVYDGGAVFEAIRSFRPDLMILDLMLPTMDGVQICRKLRSEGNGLPIIMLTAMQELSDRIAGLDHGADDYMVKPFSPQEVISRIRAVLRRSGASSPEAPPAEIHLGEICISAERRDVTLNGRLIDLTPKEFELLLYLCQHQGRALSRQQLLQNVWDYHFLGDTRIVDVHISHLRDKIEADARNPRYIQTVRSVGYKMTDPYAIPGQRKSTLASR